MFWKKRRSDNPLREKLLHPVAQIIAKAQVFFGATLNRWTSNWNRRQQKVFLFSFATCMVGVIFLQLYPTEQERTWEIPAHVPLILNDNNGIEQPKRSSQDSIILQQFHARIRQLQSTPDGRDSLREFIKRRPGFLDSVIAWEQHMK